MVFGGAGWDEAFNVDFDNFRHYDKPQEDFEPYFEPINMNDDYYPQKETFENINPCNEFEEHLKKCNLCRNKMTVIKQENFITDEILDLILYIITGIFILYLLNLFFNLGRSK